MKPFLRHVALACIVASTLPHAALAAVTMHEFLEHGAESRDSVPLASVMPLLHGHAHAADTPDHDHAMTAPLSDGTASHARGCLQLALPFGCGRAGAPYIAADVRATGEQSTNRRPSQSISSVLRI